MIYKEIIPAFTGFLLFFFFHGSACITGSKDGHMEKSPSFVHHRLHVWRVLLRSTAGRNKDTFNQVKEKSQREAIEVTQASAWNQQVPFVIFHEIIHSLDDYSGVNMEIAPTVKQRKRTWQGATVSYHQYPSSGVLYVSDWLGQDWLTGFSVHTPHLHPSHVKK